jgi:GNAT superfamily N-acetyltransferase
VRPRRTPHASVTMVRGDLEGLPRHAVPDGYAIRTHAPGDELAWVRIQSAADAYNVIVADLFRAQFGDDSFELGRRLFMLEDPAGTAIGTAAAWFGGCRRGPAVGRVHWVAIHPAHQGRGLAKPLLSRVCLALRALGHESAFLTTSTARIPAIGLYLSFGFVPEITGPADAAAWAALQRRAPGLGLRLDAGAA